MSTTAKTPSRTSRDPPATLSAPAKEHWRRLRADFDIADAAGLLLLEQALTSWDLAQRAARVVAKEGMTVSGSHGGTKPHPLIAVGRDATSAFQRALRQLNLDVLPVANKPGRPPRDW